MIDYCSAVIKNCHMALNVSSIDNYLSVLFMKSNSLRDIRVATYHYYQIHV